MKSFEFELLVKTGGINAIHVYDRRSTGGAWQLEGYFIDYEGWVIDLPCGNLLQGARGEPRKWSDLNRLVDYIRSCGWRGPISIEPPKEDSLT